MVGDVSRIPFPSHWLFPLVFLPPLPVHGDMRRCRKSQQAKLGSSYVLRLAIDEALLAVVEEAAQKPILRGTRRTRSRSAGKLEEVKSNHWDIHEDILKDFTTEPTLTASQIGRGSVNFSPCCIYQDGSYAS